MALSGVEKGRVTPGLPTVGAHRENPVHLDPSFFPKLGTPQNDPQGRPPRRTIARRRRANRVVRTKQFPLYDRLEPRRTRAETPSAHSITLTCISRSPPPGSPQRRLRFRRVTEQGPARPRATQKDAAASSGPRAHPAKSIQSSQNNTCPDGSRPREIGCAEARAEQSFEMADSRRAERTPDLLAPRRPKGRDRSIDLVARDRRVSTAPHSQVSHTRSPSTPSSRSPQRRCSR